MIGDQKHLLGVGSKLSSVFNTMNRSSVDCDCTINGRLVWKPDAKRHRHGLTDSWSYDLPKLLLNLSAKKCRQRNNVKATKAALHRHPEQVRVALQRLSLLLTRPERMVLTKQTCIFVPTTSIFLLKVALSVVERLERKSQNLQINLEFVAQIWQTSTQVIRILGLT